MTEFVPHGYISVHEAVDRLGPELFPEEWTGKEHEARRGLISEEEWLKLKDLAPARGGGAPGSAPTPKTIAAPVCDRPTFDRRARAGYVWPVCRLLGACAWRC